MRRVFGKGLVSGSKQGVVSGSFLHRSYLFDRLPSLSTSDAARALEDIARSHGYRKEGDYFVKKEGDRSLDPGRTEDREAYFLERGITELVDGRVVPSMHMPKPPKL